ncbi:phosphotransferase enzyme family protein [Microbacterium sp. ZW T5_45]|uniref:phosphotransferase enzyme family protein n=1 Tax=Microbacterium sp. ZW T5_45 TaxID=3378080 RepID=UPI00385304E1
MLDELEFSRVPDGGASSPALGPLLTQFHSVKRGDAAPRWVREGIQRAWGLPPSTQVALIVLSENVTFRVEFEGQSRLVVRFGRPGYAAGTEHIRSELVWVEALRSGAGIPTPSPVRGADGDWVQTIIDPNGAIWTAVSFEFIEGTILEEQPEFTQHYEEIGALTAALHRHASSWTPPASFTRFAWDVSDMVGTHARWGHWGNARMPAPDRGLLQRAENRAKDVLAEAEVSKSPQHFGLIHGDLRPSNVMTHDDSLAIIDFDDCGYGYYLYDFAAALTFYEHRPEASGMAAAWLDGYRSVLPLSDRELGVAAAFSMLRRLTMLGWSTTHSPDALPTDLWNENLPGTVEVAAKFLADPRWIVRN